MPGARSARHLLAATLLTLAVPGVGRAQERCLRPRPAPECPMTWLTELTFERRAGRLPGGPRRQRRYWSFSAAIGSTAAAARAGSQLAPSATSPRISPTAPNATGSRGLIP